jgi:hypothetical protein
VSCKQSQWQKLASPRNDKNEVKHISFHRVKIDTLLLQKPKSQNKMY